MKVHIGTWKDFLRFIWRFDLWINGYPVFKILLLVAVIMTVLYIALDPTFKEFQ